LLDELLGYADGGVVYLEVRTDNEPAIALYLSAGFARIGLRRRYYRVSGADAYTMRRVGARPQREGPPPACGRPP
jgi:ribosomal-protein-alanine N-acetyltransferase